MYHSSIEDVPYSKGAIGSKTEKHKIGFNSSWNKDSGQGSAIQYSTIYATAIVHHDHIATGER
jgi:hypothetical protein